MLRLWEEERKTFIRHQKERQKEKETFNVRKKYKEKKKERRFYSARHDFYAHVRMNEQMNEWMNEWMNFANAIQLN